MLLFLLMLQSGGLFVAYKMQQYAAKYAMQQSIRKSTSIVETLSMSRSEFAKSLVDNKEIRYKGKMYDIRSMSILNDSVHLMVVHDTKEENILKKIKNLFSDHHSQKNKVPQVLIQLLSLDYIQHTVNLNPFITHHVVSLNHHFSENILSQNSEILLPPPEVV